MRFSSSPLCRTTAVSWTVLLVVLLALVRQEASADKLEKRQGLTSTAGVPATPNLGTGAPVATFPSGLNGLSTGSSVVFTPGAATPVTETPFVAPTDAAGSASLASILTKYSQAMTAPTPTTGPPTGISTGLDGGFTGSRTTSVLDGRVTTVPNAATTYTGPRPEQQTATESSNAARLASKLDGAAAIAALAMGLAGVVGGAWVL